MRDHLTSSTVASSPLAPRISRKRAPCSRARPLPPPHPSRRGHPQSPPHLSARGRLPQDRQPPLAAPSSFPEGSCGRAVRRHGGRRHPRPQSSPIRHAQPLRLPSPHWREPRAGPQHLGEARRHSTLDTSRREFDPLDGLGFSLREVVALSVRLPLVLMPTAPPPDQHLKATPHPPHIKYPIYHMQLAPSQRPPALLGQLICQAMLRHSRRAIVPVPARAKALSCATSLLAPPAADPRSL
jgi:hypothetical protein